MAKTLAEAGKRLHVTDIVTHGESLTIPEGMSLANAMDLIKRRMEYENQVASFVEDFDAFPWDGAHALWKVLAAKYGWASGLPTPGFFGDTPPTMVSIEVGVGKFASIPWGRVAIPGVDGFLDLGVTMKGNRLIFKISVTTKRKNEPDVKALCRLVREYLATDSIYKGQAIKVRFRDDKGGILAMPEPKFLNVEGIGQADLIYSDNVQDDVETNLFTPIVRMKDCKAAGIPFKRGCLLAGDFGVGKTLAARIAAKLAVEAGISYIYCARADEFAQAVEFAHQYQPAVVFCEDIDRVMTGDRSVSVDDVLNIIDGLDSKRSDVMVVLTTNAVNDVTQAMLRPGRLDAVIEVTKPDAKATERLLRHYGKGVISSNADLKAVSEALKGNIPAVIAEVVKRSKLSALKRTPVGTHEIVVDEVALREAAYTMETQLRLLEGKPAAVVSPFDLVLDAIGRVVETKLGVTAKPIDGQLTAIGKALGVGGG